MIIFKFDCASPFEIRSEAKRSRSRCSSKEGVCRLSRPALLQPRDTPASRTVTMSLPGRHTGCRLPCRRCRLTGRRLPAAASPSAAPQQLLLSPLPPPSAGRRLVLWVLGFDHSTQRQPGLARRARPRRARGGGGEAGEAAAGAAVAAEEPEAAAGEAAAARSPLQLGQGPVALTCGSYSPDPDPRAITTP